MIVINYIMITSILLLRTFNRNSEAKDIRTKNNNKNVRQL